MTYLDFTQKILKARAEAEGFYRHGFDYDKKANNIHTQHINTTVFKHYHNNAPDVTINKRIDELKQDPATLLQTILERTVLMKKTPKFKKDYPIYNMRKYITAEGLELLSIMLHDNEGLYEGQGLENYFLPEFSQNKIDNLEFYQMFTFDNESVMLHRGIHEPHLRGLRRGECNSFTAKELINKNLYKKLKKTERKLINSFLSKGLDELRLLY